MAERKYPEFRKKLSPGWWLSNRRYTAYMLRELTSFFIAVFCLLYVYQVSVLASGSSVAYGNYLGLLKNPFVVVFNVVTLGFALYHSFTWFFLTGKVQPIRVGKWKTTPLVALAVNSVLFVAISFTVVMLFLVGR